LTPTIPDLTDKCDWRGTPIRAVPGGTGRGLQTYQAAFLIAVLPASSARAVPAAAPRTGEGVLTAAVQQPGQAQEPAELRERGGFGVEEAKNWPQKQLALFYV